MHIIIAGGGRSGRKLVELFKGHPQHKITVIESDPKKCELISETFPYVDIILGDATYPKTIKEAMNRNTSGFIAVTGQDYLNLLSAKAAHKMGIKKVLLRVNNPEYKELGNLMELTDILDPADAISAQVITHLNGVDFATLIHDLHMELELKRVVITSDSPLIHKNPLDLEKISGEYCYPILVKREGRYYLPSKIQSIEADDCLICWHKEQERKKVLDTILPKKRG